MKRHISKVKMMVVDKKYEEEKRYLEKLFRVLKQPYIDIQTSCVNKKYNENYDFTIVKGLVLALSDLDTVNLKMYCEAKLKFLSGLVVFHTKKTQELCKKQEFTKLQKEINLLIRRKYSSVFMYRSKLLINLSYLYFHFTTKKDSTNSLSKTLERLDIICEILSYEYLHYSLLSGVAITDNQNSDDTGVSKESENIKDLDGVQDSDSTEVVTESKEVSGIYTKIEYFDGFSLSKDAELNIFASLYDSFLKHMLTREKEMTRENIVISVFNEENIQEKNSYLEPVRNILSLNENIDICFENNDYNSIYQSIVLNSLNTIEQNLNSFAEKVFITSLKVGYATFVELKNLESQDCNLKIKELKSENRVKNKELLKKDIELSELKSEVVSNKRIVEEQVVLKQTNMKVEELESETQRLRERISVLTNDYDKVTLKCQHQEQEIKTLKMELREISNVESDMMYLQNENTLLKLEIDKLEDSDVDADVEQEEYNRRLKELSDIPILFVGGVGNMMSKFKTLFPNSDYIDISNDGTSFVVPPRFQYVVIYTKMVSHAHCERIESQISNKKIIPINIFNTKLVVNEIYNAVCLD